MNQLEIIEQLNPAQIFGGGSIDGILDKIMKETKAAAEALDISTPVGRKEIASLAHKVARSKTFLDGIGEKLGEEHRTVLNAINAERKKSREALDKLKEEVRKPLTEWEQKEEDRIKGHQAELQNLVTLGNTLEIGWQNHTVDYMTEQLEYLLTYERDWQEFAEPGKKAVNVATDKVRVAKEKLIIYLREQEELKAFRAHQMAEEQRKRDEKIAQEAADLVRIKAEREAAAAAEKAAEEKQKIINDKLAAEARERKAIAEKEEFEKRTKAIELQREEDRKLAAKREEERAVVAKMKAEEEKQAAIKNERDQIEAKLKAEADAAAKREANRKHQAKIHNEILAAMATIALDPAVGKQLITMIVTQKIPHIKIQY